VLTYFLHTVHSCSLHGVVAGSGQTVLCRVQATVCVVNIGSAEHKIQK